MPPEGTGRTHEGKVIALFPAQSELGRARFALFLLLAMLFVGSGARAEEDNVYQAAAQPPSRTSAPIIELISYSIGDSIWSRFGHSALRVVDPARQTDLVYNFGHADFSQRGFVWRYLRHNSHFNLGVRTWESALGHYRRENRTVERQRLNLSDAQARSIAERLRVNALPENREYLYDQLLDNCATRIRDLLEEVTGGSLRRAVEGSGLGRTYRYFTLDASKGAWPILFVLDFAAGSNQERTVDGWAELYLPERLREAVAAASLDDEFNTRPLAESIVVGFLKRGPPSNEGNPFAVRYLIVAIGFTVALLVLLAGLIPLHTAITRLAGVALLLTSLLVGLLGSGLLLLISIARVPDFAWNETVVAWLPTDVLLVRLGWRWLRAGRVEVSGFFRRYVIARSVLLVPVVTARVTGLFIQDNWAFLALPSLLFAALYIIAMLTRRHGSTTRRQRRTAPTTAS